MTAQPMPVLDLADCAAPGGSLRRNRGRVIQAMLGLIVAVLCAWLARDLWDGGREAAAPALRIELAPAPAIARLNVDDRAQIIASGSEAVARNAAIPMTTTAVPMRAFRLAAPSDTAANALKCLTQAIYYEAATEPLEGRRAVAQVVLNRVRHPAYPKSVCGVVYQGAELFTGCQFSFTCDGALLRAPMAGPWREAQQIAREALAGRVEPEVGTATHYHADYVLPRWAFQMDKIAQLGRHLFYRFEGSWGRPAFFGGAYNAREVIPALDFSRLRARLIAGHGLAAPDAGSFAPGLTVAPQITDRHAENDVGGRIDMTRSWRPSIPDPTASAGRYQALVGEDGHVAPSASGTQVAP